MTLSRQPPQLASQLAALGLRVFPCKGDKSPAVAQWKVAEPPFAHWPSPLFGIVIDERVVVIDLDTYKGLSREQVDAALGCALPWDAALIQTTPQGGQHYAFRKPAWPVRFGKNLGDIRGLDTRTDGKGFICSGPGYRPAAPMGLFRLGSPESLPELPDCARAVLEFVPPPPPDRPVLPVTDADLDMLRQALSAIDPGCTRAEWVRIMAALRHQFHDDPDTGFALFDAWSAGELWKHGCPPNYEPEVQQAQWNSVRPDGGITVATLFWQAVQSGWVPPPTLDPSAAFGPASAEADSIRLMVDKILAHGSDPRQTWDLVAQVSAMPCDMLQRGVLLATLDRELREAGLLTPVVREALQTAAGGHTAAPTAPPLAPGTILDPTQPVPPVMWFQGHTKGKERRPRGTRANFRIMLDAYGVQVQWDVIGKRLVVRGAGIPERGTLVDEAVLSHLDSLANLNDYPKPDVVPMLTAEATNHEFNPVTEWVRSRPWDGRDHLGQLFRCIALDPVEDRTTAELLFRNWFRGAVAIGTGATSKMEYVLVFVDPEGGAGKTRFFASLCPPALQKDSVTLDMHQKDSIKTATSYWLVELGELDGTFNRSDQARLKSFLSAHEDEIRLPYGRAYLKYPRHTAFFASVNQSSFLVDGSHNRRFWPIRVKYANHNHGVDVQQVWAQVDAEVQQGTTWHATSDMAEKLAEHNEQFRVNSPAVDLLSAAYLIGHPPAEHRTVTEALRLAGMANPSKTDLNEAARFFRARGYEERKRAGTRGFVLPPLASAAGPGGAFTNVVPITGDK